MAEVFSREISATADDGRGNISFASTSTQYAIGRSGGNPLDGFYRFPNVTIPQGATILTATIQIYGVGSGGGTASNLSMAVRANTVDNAVAPTSSADFLAKSWSTAQGVWAPSAFTTGYKVSGDLSAVVQEVTDRAGWVSGNALMLSVREQAVDNTFIDVRDVTGGDGNYPILDVTYDLPSLGFTGFGIPMGIA